MKWIGKLGHGVKIRSCLINIVPRCLKNVVEKYEFIFNEREKYLAATISRFQFVKTLSFKNKRSEKKKNEKKCIVIPSKRKILKFDVASYKRNKI